jgi:hypothetical protein
VPTRAKGGLYQGRWHLTLWAIPLAREA